MSNHHKTLKISATNSEIDLAKSTIYPINRVYKYLNYFKFNIFLSFNLRTKKLLRLPCGYYYLVIYRYIVKFIYELRKGFIIELYPMFYWVNGDWFNA